MKRRVRKIANFFAFNLLFFALYLNFIHKDKMVPADQNVVQQRTAAFSGPVLVVSPEKLLEKKNTATTVAAQPAAFKESNTGDPLKLSIN